MLTDSQHTFKNNPSTITFQVSSKTPNLPVGAHTLKNKIPITKNTAAYDIWKECCVEIKYLQRDEENLPKGGREYLRGLINGEDRLR